MGGQEWPRRANRVGILPASFEMSGKCRGACRNPESATAQSRSQDIRRKEKSQGSCTSERFLRPRTQSRSSPRESLPQERELVPRRFVRKGPERGRPVQFSWEGPCLVRLVGHSRKEGVAQPSQQVREPRFSRPSPVRWWLLYPTRPQIMPPLTR